ncbi:MAG: NarK/NasA family nitrate transporter [Planctomycetes bacterium]|nr:NarK/NasA family nitrate transporter [Planctomycetota bacterium]
MQLKAFTRSGHWPTLLMSFLYFDVSFMVWVLLGVLGVYISKDFNLSPAQKGLMAALPILGGSLARLPMGLLVDRIGPKKTGILGQLLILLPLLWAWKGGADFSQVLGLGFLLGIAGGSFAVALPLASRWYPAEHQGLAMGIAGAGNSGTVLAALFAPRLAEAFGWHAVFGLALIPVSVVLALFVLFAKESPSQPAPKPLKAYFAILRERDTGWFSLLYSFTFGGFVGLASFLVIFFHDQYGVSKVAAGTLAALCVFSGSFMRPVGGFLSDKFGGVRVLTVLLAFSACCLAGMALLPPLAVAMPLIIAAMGTLGLGNGSVFQLVPQRFRKEIGVATGLIGAAGGLGGFLLPNVLGLLKGSTGSFATGFLLLALAGAACTAVLMIQRRKWLESLLPETPAAAMSAAPAAAGNE